MWAGLVRGRARLRVRDRDEVGVERCQVWVGLRDDCKGHVEHGAHLSRVRARVSVGARIRVRARVRVRVRVKVRGRGQIRVRVRVRGGVIVQVR